VRVRLTARNTFFGLVIAGVAAGVLFLPAVGFLGGMFVATPPPQAATHVPPLVGDALWAMANGGRAAELQPINPFTVGRLASCHLWVELSSEPQAKDEGHDDCMTLLPAIEAVGLVSNAHLRSQGIHDDPRVPFAGLATINRVADKWTRSQLLDAVAERADFSFGFHGVEEASRGFFNRPAAQLSLPQAALLAGLLRERHQDPWCWPVSTAAIRRSILKKMRDNLAIDEAAFASADTAPLDLNPEPPPNRKPCE
jgi:hypothetical protein